jgi:hypothetical protein
VMDHQLRQEVTSIKRQEWFLRWTLIEASSLQRVARLDGLL